MGPKKYADIGFSIFPAHGKNGPRWAQMGSGGFFPTNPDLADILGRTDFDFENFYFLDFLGPHIGPGLGPAWAQLGPSLGPAWAQLGPNLGPGLGPGLGPDAAGAGRILRSQPDPSPNAPRDEIRRKDLCCDIILCESR